MNPQQKPAGAGRPAAGNSNATDSAPNSNAKAQAVKDFETLRAAFALKGHALHRGHPDDGEPTFWVERWGLARHLPSIDSVRRFLEQVGGKL